MTDLKWSLPAAWRNGELTPEGVSHCHHHLLPDIQDLERDLGSVEKAVKGYLDAVGNLCGAGSLMSSTFSKLLRDTTLSNISQQYQQVSEQVEHSAHQSSVDITNCVLATLCDFTSTLPGVKREIEKYKRCRDNYEKRCEALESFAQQDASASEGRRFQLAKERFHLADKECTEQQEQLSQCLSSLEGNRIKMLGASLLSLMHTLAQFFAGSSSMLAPLGEYQSVGDYLQDREIAPQLKEATAVWCSLAQSYQCVRESEYLSGHEIYQLLKHKKGHELAPFIKNSIKHHVKTLLETYKKDIEGIEDGPVVVPGGFSKNPAGIGVALKGCCSKLEVLALEGISEAPSHEQMFSSLKCEIQKVELTVGSVGKSWYKVSNLKDSDVILSRQHCIQDLVEPLAKQFDIPFTKESFKSFTLTVLNEACCEKTIFASKIAVQLLYGKSDLVAVKLSPDSTKCRSVRIYCKETSVNIEVQLTWWITSDKTLFSGILDNEEEDQPLLIVDTTYCTVIDYMDYLEEKESRLPSITVEIHNIDETQDDLRETAETNESVTACSMPVAPPRTKHYARKIAARRKKAEMDIEVARSVESSDGKKSSESSGKGKDQGTAAPLSLASESELSEVINFLSGVRPRVIADAADGDTESLCSFKAMSDSGIDSVKNAKLAGKNIKAVDPSAGDAQTKGKKGKKKKEKAAAKSESFSKKKRKKRGDKAKKEKKKAASGATDEQGGRDQIDAKENKTESKEKNKEGLTEEAPKDASKMQKTESSGSQNGEATGKEVVVLSESLRSVWEQGDKDCSQTNTIPGNNLSLRPVPNLASQSAALYGSQESIYQSCWSLSGLATKPDDPKPSVDSSNNPSRTLPELNFGQCWSKVYEQEPARSQRSIWSPPPHPKLDNGAEKESWPPSLKRQPGVELDESEPASLVGESVFSLGLGVTGFELFAAAKQSGGILADDRKVVHSSLSDPSVTSQTPVWAQGKLAAGQLTEKSSSYGDGLHRPYHPAEDHIRMQTHHSDPFLAKDITWTSQVPPMYMRVRYNPNIVAPYPSRDVPGPYGSPQQTRAAGSRSNRPVQTLGAVDRRRQLPQFYVPSNRPGAGPL